MTIESSNEFEQEPTEEVTSPADQVDAYIKKLEELSGDPKELNRIAEHQIVGYIKYAIENTKTQEDEDAIDRLIDACVANDQIKLNIKKEIGSYRTGLS